MEQEGKSGLIRLEDAQQLVELLSAGEQAQAEDLFREMASPLQKDLFDEVGKLTRQLHSALVDFQIDSKLQELAQTELPDAKERLNFVIDMTENAANKTMDAVEECLPLAEALTVNVHQVQPSWDKLMRRDLDINEFKSLCHDVQQFIGRTEQDSTRVKELLNEILMAQDFQDLTGQMIRRVIQLVKDVETNLVSLLTVFGDIPHAESEPEQLTGIEAEGPIMNAELREDVVAGQDEVDDLLSSLGF
ncbi:protein phosphatase CheZ [Shewanella sp. GXUN23E]|uniref:protein phosphatase CheZ n=1 Tax=Shewanella sp. GXUN23E TaxID=3422498 RepID=UPI003D7D1861